jgi:hypothetical protein
VRWPRTPGCSPHPPSDVQAAPEVMNNQWVRSRRHGVDEEQDRGRRELRGGPGASCWHCLRQKPYERWRTCGDLQEGSRARTCTPVCTAAAAACTMRTASCCSHSRCCFRYQPWSPLFWFRYQRTERRLPKVEGGDCCVQSLLFYRARGTSR